MQSRRLRQAVVSNELVAGSASDLTARAKHAVWRCTGTDLWSGDRSFTARAVRSSGSVAMPAGQRTSIALHARC